MMREPLAISVLGWCLVGALLLLLIAAVSLAALYVTEMIIAQWKAIRR